MEDLHGFNFQLLIIILVFGKFVLLQYLVVVLYGLIQLNQVNISFLLNILFIYFKGYVKSSQALEIIALVFYIIAACLIVLGILNIKGLSYEIPFIGAAGLLFISCMF